MKKTVVTMLAAFALLSACHRQQPLGQTAGTETQVINAQSVAPDPNAPNLKFTEEKFDFGKINQGDSVKHEFAFTNTGKTPLVITDAIASCGCTKPDWPKTPIAPGANGVIKVTFHSAGKSGLQDKMITITANTVPPQTMVHLTGEVITPDAQKK
jgi:hypothetical protein